MVKGTIHDIEGEFDLIMFHHSLEHMSEQRGVLARVRKLLATGGWCLIRLPVVPNDAWQEFRENWVQLDAPRHEIIHSVDSLTRLAGEGRRTGGPIAVDVGSEDGLYLANR